VTDTTIWVARITMAADMIMSTVIVITMMITAISSMTTKVTVMSMVASATTSTAAQNTTTNKMRATKHTIARVGLFFNTIIRTSQRIAAMTHKK